MSDLTNDLRTRYECTAGFTRNIYMPEQRDLDIQAADALDRFEVALKEISKGEGAYNQRPLQHAENAIENMVDIADRALKESK